MKGYEEPVEKLLKNRKIRFQREMRVNFSNNDSGRLYARVDFHIMKRNENGKIIGHIVLEVDEHQNVDYIMEEELIRMIQVSNSFKYNDKGLKIYWIRYNASEYYVDVTQASPNFKAANEQLLNAIANAAFKKPISISYLYYDVTNGLPAIFSQIKLSGSYYRVSCRCSI